MEKQVSLDIRRAKPWRLVGESGSGNFIGHRAFDPAPVAYPGASPSGRFSNKGEDLLLGQGKALRQVRGNRISMKSFRSQ